MIFNGNRDTMRQFYIDVWQKRRSAAALEPLESLVADVISEHPEYHPLLERGEQALASEFYPEHGQSNPFLHMGMHIALREQVGTDRPAGIADLTRQMLLRYQDSHAMEHRMMECLGESLWNAQRNNAEPDEQAYMQCLRRLAAKPL